MWIFKAYSLLSLQEHQELLEIRNEEQIRVISKTQDVILMQNHLHWLQNIEKRQHYFALFIENKIVGGLNFSSKGNIVENWGIFFSKNSQPFIASLATYLFIEYMLEKYSLLYSEVAKQNKQALKFNNYFGLKIIEEKENFYQLQLSKTLWKEQKEKLSSLQKRIKTINYIFISREDDD